MLYYRLGDWDMPIISRFYGIAIYMFWREHEPAHFHAKYGDDEVVVEIENGRVIGHINARALALVEEWRKLHLSELKEDEDANLSFVPARCPVSPCRLV